MAKNEPPPPPDPTATAAAAAKTNKETAVTQYGLNATNQNAPQGSLKYSQVGTWADGTPRFEATTSLNQGEQQVYDTDLANRQKLGTVSGQQIDRVGNLLSTPVQLGNEATEGRLMELGSKRLDPIFGQRQSALETKLANQGITQGSEAWQNQMNQFGRDRNDAYNNLLLTGRGQANQELLTERNQPINEITALSSGSQVSQPNWIGTPQTQVGGVDYAGIANSNYQGQMAGYAADQARTGAMIGGIAGLGGTALGGWARGGLATPKFG